MKRAFIDCGGHKGESIVWAQKNTDCTEFHSFEPNMDLWKHFQEPVVLHKYAVWIADGVIDFYYADKDVGSTVMRGKKTAGVRYDRPYEVPCIDLGRWIKDNFTRNDYIVLKMNIEGAEYAVLQSMVKDGSIKFVNELYVEFHKKKFDGIDEVEAETRELVEKEIEIKDWIL